MQAHQVLNDRTIYDPCLPDGEGHHECVGVGLPVDGDAPTIGPCECTCHRGVVVLNADRPQDDAPALLAELTWALDVIEDNGYSDDAEENEEYSAALSRATDARDGTATPKPDTLEHYLEALTNIAAFHYDGEEIEGSDDPVELSIDDAFEIARESVSYAREAISKAGQAATRVHVVITADSGIVEGATLFRDGAKAAEYAREQWRDMTGSDEPDGDSITGTHDDEHDVWLFEEQLGNELVKA